MVPTEEKLPKSKIRNALNDFYKKTRMLVTMVIFATLLAVLEFVHRLYNFILQIVARQDEKFVDIAATSFSWNLPTLIAIIIFSVSLTVLYIKNRDIVSRTLKSPAFTILSGFAIAYLMLRRVGLTNTNQNNDELLKMMKGLDYGTGMASSYFYGYLKIILPSNGREYKGIREKMEKYEVAEGVKIPVKKLFILIPSSSYIAPDLHSMTDKWMESAKNLEFVVVDRAGVKERRYQNTVYKIVPNGTETGLSPAPVYVVAEGATPICSRSMKFRFTITHSLVYRDHKEEIIKLFYQSLQQLLNDNPDCKDYCELVYYEDYDENGKRVNPAKIILDRIRSQTLTMP